MNAHIAALACDAEHRFSKELRDSVVLLAGRGVQGDAHAGVLVQHLSRQKKDPRAANLRQVHLIHGELLDELAGRGFAIGPGQLGENVLTRGIDLLGLSTGTRLRLGGDALVEITGLRNPCHQLNAIAAGLMEATLDRAADGSLIRKCGVMAVVVSGGEVRTGDPVKLDSMPRAHQPLQPV